MCEETLFIKKLFSDDVHCVCSRVGGVVFYSMGKMCMYKMESRLLCVDKRESRYFQRIIIRFHKNRAKKTHKTKVIMCASKSNQNMATFFFNF